MEAPYHTFALHNPDQAYLQDPDKFCEVARSEGWEMTDKEIHELMQPRTISN